MLHWLLWSAALTACLNHARSQITVAEQPGVRGVCRIAPSAASVLPDGFRRSITDPYSSLEASQGNATKLLMPTAVLRLSAAQVDGQPHKAAARLSGCQFVSLDPEFDRLLGPSPIV